MVVLSDKCNVCEKHKRGNVTMWYNFLLRRFYYSIVVYRFTFVLLKQQTSGFSVENLSLSWMRVLYKRWVISVWDLGGCIKDFLPLVGWGDGQLFVFTVPLDDASYSV